MNRLELEAIVYRRREEKGRNFENTHSMDESVERLGERLAVWDEKLKPLVDANLGSEDITADDLNIRINV